MLTVEDPRLVLGPMLRHVTETSATIFVETDRACTVTILDRVAATFHVRGHHYALVIIEDLEPDSITEYEVDLDGVRQWPPPPPTGGSAAKAVPPSVIRTSGHARAQTVMFGSCRAVAPHERPWTLELTRDDRGRGVDALWAHACTMLTQEPREWPDLVVLCGDQIYADDTSPVTRDRIRQRRSDGEDLPEDLVRDFEEYCWLYHEAWKPDIERWFFSVVPSVMIFDDHDMIDDWNISSSWVEDIRTEPWWSQHVTDGLMSYWIYQHLGNLSPQAIRDEGILAGLTSQSDGGALLEKHALTWDRRSPKESGYRFSFARDIGTTRIVVIDARNARVLEGDRRLMVDESEWAWISEQCTARTLDTNGARVGHLVIVSSLPVFVPGALHDLQVWNEAVAQGAWGRLPSGVAERIRRSIDLEDWPAFHRSFVMFTELLRTLSDPADQHAPASISVVSGDIHFSYLAKVSLPIPHRPIHQIVCSPLRNALEPLDRRAIKSAMTRSGRRLGRLLHRSVRRSADGDGNTECRWSLRAGPVFANCVGFLTFDGQRASCCIEQAYDHVETGPTLVAVVEALLADG